MMTSSQVVAARAGAEMALPVGSKFDHLNKIG
jgi:hypothetical protein